MKDLVNVVKDLFTEDSISNLESEFANAQKVLDNEKATQEEVDNALAKLNETYQALEAKESEVAPQVNTKILEKLIENIESKLDELGQKITESSKSALELALVDAKEVLKETPLTQEKVDAAFGNLLNGLTSIEFKEEEIETPTVDKSALNQLIERANGKLEKELEEDSRENLEKTVAKAKEVIEKDNVTIEEYNEVFSQLVDALLNAKEKEVQQAKLLEAKGYIKGRTNVRVEPKGQVIGTLAKGAVVEGKYEEGSNWVKFNYYGQEAYVYKPLLSDTIEAKGFASGDTNIRQIPNGKIVGQAKYGEVLEGEVSINSPNWLKTEKGYVYKPLVVDTIRVKGFIIGTTNVRRNPNGQIIGILRKAEYVEGTVNISSPNWLRIRYDGQDAYIYRSLVEKNVSVNAKTTGSVNVRQTPNGKILTVLKKGTTVNGKTLVSYPNWLEIQYKGQRAYVYRPLVK